MSCQSQETRQSVDILGVKVDRVTMKEAVERVGQMMKEGGQHQVVTPNPEHIMLAQEDKEFRDILNRADLAIPDGVGLVWASRVLAGTEPSVKTRSLQSLQERVAGTDLMEGLCQAAAQQGWSVFFLGGEPGVATEAAQRLVERYPGLKVLGTSSADPAQWKLEAGSLKLEEKLEARSSKSNLQPPVSTPTSSLQFPASDLLFVAYGAPTQEKWIAQHLPQLPVKVAMGVGGAFDFIIGRQKRAPYPLRHHGLEWLWRLITQPWRIKRQLALVKFVLLVINQRLHS